MLSDISPVMVSPTTKTPLILDKNNSTTTSVPIKLSTIAVAPDIEPVICLPAK